MKNSTKRKWKKGIAVRAAALTFFVTILLVYGVGMYLFSDFVFLQNNRTPATPSAAFLSPAEKPSPMLSRTIHTEQIGVPGGTDAADPAGYVLLPADSFAVGETAAAALSAAGIGYELRYCYSVQPEGNVVYVEYAGYSDENGYYVNPDVPVTLTLSGNKRETAAFDGTNRVYLTFDDGPSAYTDEILDTLGLYGIPATFFTLGTSAEKYPDMARRITEDGHLLASHGTTHAYESIYTDTASLLADVRRWQDIVTSIGALPESEHYYFRFPGGSVSGYFGETQRQAMIDGLHGMGYRIYDWNILTNDGVLFQRPAGMDSRTFWKQSFIETWENCSSDIRIILMHDNVAETEELLTWLLQYVIDQGYTFGTLDELDTEYFMR
ncbi:MAG: polysaccharide deacetylase family protein [Clostridia bacterium]|nr:polysaccharide deacetylase family protein [Clostridia bacterium]